MSRLSRTLLVLLGVTFLVPVIAFARIDDSSTGLRAAGSAAGLSNACSGNASACIATIVGRAINVVLTFVGIVLLCYFLYGGFLWMTAGGNGKRAGEAKDVFMNAVIGMFVIAVSFAVSGFVLNQLGSIVTGSGGGVVSENGSGLDDLMDRAIGACCYTALTDCTSACMAGPASRFGLTSVSETACTNYCTDPARVTLCSARPAGTPVCPSGGSPPPPLSPPPPPPWTRATFCATARTAVTGDRCTDCINACLADICEPVLDPRTRVPIAPIFDPLPRLESETDATNARARCRTEHCSRGTGVGGTGAPSCLPPP